ncbi:Uncharacterised protein [Mycobacterium tuberculosis]|nr:Uncharacterised protein [Mycobacterium tuberculosis]
MRTVLLMSLIPSHRVPYIFGILDSAAVLRKVLG